MYLFFLGSQKSVSIAEVIACFGNDVSLVGTDFLKVASVDEQKVRSLGGIPRVDRFLKEFSLEDGLEKIYRTVAIQLETNDSRKYSLSFIGFRNDDVFPEMKAAAKVVGKNPEGDRQKSIATYATVFYVLQKGGKSFSIVKTEGKYELYETFFVQDPNYWTMIDFDRPHREKEVGMLPAKLARIMINLATPDASDYILDPFVGLGTVSMQADLLGYKSIGMDINRQNVSLAEENCQWMVKKGLSANRQKIFVVHDVKKPFFENITQRGIGAIVCEPFLGPMRSRPFKSYTEAEQSFRQHVRPLITALIQRGAETLQNGQKIVFIKPIYKYIENHQSKWYNSQVQYDSQLWSDWTKKHDLKPLQWVQKDSTIGREIMVLEKIK